MQMCDSETDSEDKENSPLQNNNEDNAKQDKELSPVKPAECTAPDNRILKVEFPKDTLEECTKESSNLIKSEKSPSECDLNYLFCGSYDPLSENRTYGTSHITFPQDISETSNASNNIAMSKSCENISDDKSYLPEIFAGTPKKMLENEDPFIISNTRVQQNFETFKDFEEKSKIPNSELFVNSQVSDNFQLNIPSQDMKTGLCEQFQIDVMGDSKYCLEERKFDNKSESSVNNSNLLLFDFGESPSLGVSVCEHTSQNNLLIENFQNHDNNSDNYSINASKLYSENKHHSLKNQDCDAGNRSSVSFVKKDDIIQHGISEQGIKAAVVVEVDDNGEFGLNPFLSEKCDVSSVEGVLVSTPSDSPNHISNQTLILKNSECTDYFPTVNNGSPDFFDDNLKNWSISEVNNNTNASAEIKNTGTVGKENLCSLGLEKTQGCKIPINETNIIASFQKCVVNEENPISDSKTGTLENLLFSKFTGENIHLKCDKDSGKEIFSCNPNTETNIVSKISQTFTDMENKNFVTNDPFPMLNVENNPSVIYTSPIGPENVLVDVEEKECYYDSKVYFEADIESNMVSKITQSFTNMENDFVPVVDTFGSLDADNPRAICLSPLESGNMFEDVEENECYYDSKNVCDPDFESNIVGKHFVTSDSLVSLDAENNQSVICMPPIESGDVIEDAKENKCQFDSKISCDQNSEINKITKKTQKCTDLENKHFVTVGTFASEDAEKNQSDISMLTCWSENALADDTEKECYPDSKIPCDQDTERITICNIPPTFTGMEKKDFVTIDPFESSGAKSYSSDICIPLNELGNMLDDAPKECYPHFKNSFDQDTETNIGHKISRTITHVEDKLFFTIDSLKSLDTEINSPVFCISPDKSGKVLEDDKEKECHFDSKNSAINIASKLDTKNENFVITDTFANLDAVKSQSDISMLPNGSENAFEDVAEKECYPHSKVSCDQDTKINTAHKIQQTFTDIENKDFVTADPFRSLDVENNNPSDIYISPNWSENAFEDVKTCYPPPKIACDQGAETDMVSKISPAAADVENKYLTIDSFASLHDKNSPADNYMPSNWSWNVLENTEEKECYPLSKIFCDQNTKTNIASKITPIASDTESKHFGAINPFARLNALHNQSSICMSPKVSGTTLDNDQENIHYSHDYFVNQMSSVENRDLLLNFDSDMAHVNETEIIPIKYSDVSEPVTITSFNTSTLKVANDELSFPNEKMRDTNFYMHNVSDLMQHSGEEFNLSPTIFDDPSTFEYLLKAGSSEATQVLGLGRPSVVSKFDPLLTASPQARKHNHVRCKQSGGIMTIEEDKELSKANFSSVKSVELEPNVDKNISILVNVDSPLKKSDIKTFTEDQLKKILKMKEMEFQESLIQTEKNHTIKVKVANESMENLCHQTKCLSSTYMDTVNCMSGIISCVKVVMNKRNEELTTAVICRQKVLKERDQALEDLENVEKAFSDLMGRYEKTKSVLEQMKENEKPLKQQVENTEKEVQEHDEKYNLLHIRAEERIHLANAEIQKISKDNEAEIAVVNAMLRKSEIKLRSLTMNLEQTMKDNKDLSHMCEEFGFKYHRSGDKI